MSEPTKRWHVGQRVDARALVGLRDEPLLLPDPAQLVHLQFRRFAGCPVCDLHLRSIARRSAELRAAGVREIVVFHSRAEELRQYGAHELPFGVVADPDKRLYREFGVESAARALTDPRAFWPILRGVTATLARALLGRAPLRIPSAQGGRLGLPADFLLGRDGRVLACKYGEHAYDQWSVDDVLAHAGAASS